MPTKQRNNKTIFVCFGTRPFRECPIWIPQTEASGESMAEQTQRKPIFLCLQEHFTVWDLSPTLSWSWFCQMSSCQCVWVLPTLPSHADKHTKTNRKAHHSHFCFMLSASGMQACCFPCKKPKPLGPQWRGPSLNVWRAWTDQTSLTMLWRHLQNRVCRLIENSERMGSLSATFEITRRVNVASKMLFRRSRVAYATFSRFQTSCLICLMSLCLGVDRQRDPVALISCILDTWAERYLSSRSPLRLNTYRVQM